MTKYIKKQNKKTKKNQKGKGSGFSKHNNRMTKEQKEEESKKNHLKQINKQSRYLKELFKNHPELSKQDIINLQTMAAITTRNTAKNVMIGGTNDCELSVVGKMKDETNSWGDFAYNRQFFLQGSDCQTGWIVQSIQRKTEATDVSGNKYYDNDSILSLTTEQVKESNNKYVELFRVEDGDTIDEIKTKKIKINDEFASGPIKKYYLSTTKSEKYETDNDNGSDDTSGSIQMNSKAYFIKSTDNIDTKIRNIGKNVSAANGLRSEYGLQLYTDLKPYKSSNVWCCDLHVSWEGGDENDENAGNNIDTIKEYSCDNKKRSITDISSSFSDEPSNKRITRSMIGGKRKTCKRKNKRKTRKGRKSRR
jgi:hypothetical protein